MKTSEIIDVAASHYIPSREGVIGHEADEDRVLQLMMDAFMAYIDGFGNNVHEVLMTLRWHHENMALADSDLPAGTWIAGFDSSTLGQVSLGPFPSFELAKDALILILRKAMGDAFEMFDASRAGQLRLILEQLKNEDMEAKVFTMTTDADEHWYIRDNPAEEEENAR